MSGGAVLRRSIATVSLSGTLEEKLHAASLAGFDGIELFEPDLLGCPWSPSEVGARCEDLGLAIELFQPIRDVEAVPRERHEACVARVRDKLAVAAELGAPVVLVCSNVREDALDDDELAAEDLHELGELAGELGVAVAYEALSWGRRVRTYRHAAKVVGLADHPSVGVCLDSFHVLSLGDSPEGIAEIEPSRLTFLQLADAPYVAMDLLQWSRHHRCFPGQGAFDLVDFTGRVLAAGYRGPLSLEIFNDTVRRTDALATAVAGMRSLLALEDGLARAAGPTGAGPAGVDPTGAGDAVQLRALPEGSLPERVAGVELRGDARTAVRVEQVLARMGFEGERDERDWREGRWRSGRADVTVRREAHASVTTERCVSGLTIACADPDGAAARARSLLAPTAALAGEHAWEVVVTDRLTIRAVRSHRDGVDERVGAAPAGAPGGGVRGIDHVVLAVTGDELDEATLFYRSVLLLEAQPGEELASPDGLVRSRALTAGRVGHDGCARIALNAPLAAGLHGVVHEREHVAFSCDDIFSVARAWRRCGVPLLDIPDNYYDDLRSRLGVDEALLGSLQTLGILYDTDDAGNCFYHCYSEAVGEGLFFELVQRSTGYEGYGAGNAAVRMAAQRWKERAAAAS